jgi:hypothetical protein
MSIAQATKMAELQAQIDALWAAVTELRTKEIEATAEKRRPMLRAKDRPNEDDRLAASRGA